MRFLLDMGISYKVALWLNNIGHNAVHLNDEGLHDLPDHFIIEKAINENRIILTADMDFRQIVASAKIDSVSIIQFRLADFSPANVTLKLGIICEKFREELSANYVIITVQENKIRLKHLPI